MDCDICSRSFTGRRKPLCTSCAQMFLYGPRIQQATRLLDREKSHTHAEAVIRPGNDGVLAALPDDADFDVITAAIQQHSCRRIEAKRKATEYRIDQIVDKAGELKQQIEDYRRTVAAQKGDLERRRKELAAEYNELKKHKPRALDPVHSATKKTIQRLEKTRSRIVEARMLLCHEAASASNFQRRKNSAGKTEYTLGGLVIPDLRELNLRTQPSQTMPTAGSRTVAEPHDLVSGAFDNLAHILSLCAHYLSVRLPAEIILAHEDFPRAVVMPERSSYKFKNVAFPGLSSSRSGSPAASRVLEKDKALPRSRQLWLDRPLSQLCKDDPKAFGLFLEGATLLAWDLAWICRTQGIDNIDSFEDVCTIGRNLWHLLMAQSRHNRPRLERRFSTTSSKDDHRLGVFSHASVKYNLASAEGLDLVKDWKLASARVSDKARSYLLTEISGAEWDVLSDHEWDEAREDEQPVFVGGSSVAPWQQDGTGDEAASTSNAKGKGNNGWMKVRGRN